MKRFNFTHKISAITTAFVVAKSGAAHAAPVTFVDVTSKITDSSATLPNLISTVAYIGGVGLGVAGIFKLKQHVDNPAQNQMKDGLIRLAAGGALLGLPFVTSAMMSTIGDQSTKPSVPIFDKANTGLP